MQVILDPEKPLGIQNYCTGRLGHIDFVLNNNRNVFQLRVFFITIGKVLPMETGLILD